MHVIQHFIIRGLLVFAYILQKIKSKKKPKKHPWNSNIAHAPGDRFVLTEKWSTGAMERYLRWPCDDLMLCYQQLPPCITCNYKWPWAADEEPIRFQLACQPKTNYLLALTAGFYLHNSNPSANYNLQAAATRSYMAELTVYRLSVLWEARQLFSTGKLISSTCEQNVIIQNIPWHITGRLSHLNWKCTSRLTDRARLIWHETHSFSRSHKIISYRTRKQYRQEHINNCLNIVYMKTG